MNRVAPPEMDPFDSHVAVIDGKQQPRKARLEFVWPRVKGRMEEYARCSADFGSMNESRWSCTEMEDFVHCYEKSTVARDGLVSDIFDHHRMVNSDYCQYCGINTVDTIDHYAPKEKFPEFSVFSLNMVPCCGRCNNLKGSRFRVDASLAFLSIYFDQIPREQFLFVDISWNCSRRSAVAKYRIANPDGIEEDLFQRVESHCHFLRLIDRYELCAPRVLSELGVTLKQVSTESGLTDMASLLQKQARAKAEVSSVNSWEAVLLDSVSRDYALLKLLWNA